MANDKLNDRDDEMGRVLEKSFRKAVLESREHGYVSFTDRPANAGISILPPFIMTEHVRDASGAIHFAKDAQRSKKPVKKSA